MSARRLTMLLFALILVLAAAGAWPWLASRSAAAPSPPPLPELVKVPADLPPLASFPETLARPVFAAGRRPAVAAAPASMRPALSGRLEGVVLAGSARHALVREGSQVRRVAEGDSVGAWTVRRIERDRVLLESGGEEAVLQREPQSR